MKLIIGLGNIGKKYENTRHNTGFLVLDKLSQKLQVPFSNNTELNSEVAETNVDGTKVILAKPTTFMNLSGEAVQKLVQKFNINLNDIWIVYDDVDLDFGMLRIRKEGSAGGHNGLKSLIQHLSSDKFTRFRIGIGAAPENIALEDWVLSKFTKQERDELANITNKVTDKILSSIESGIEHTTENL